MMNDEFRNIVMWKSYRVYVVGSFCLFVAASGGGCKGNAYQYAEVSGKVLCNGKPAVGGIVIFRPLDDPDKTRRPKGEPGPASIGRVDSDGRFSLITPASGKKPKRAGALIGPHEIAFQLPPTTPAEIHPELLETLSPEEAAKLKTELETLKTYEPLECGSVIMPASAEVKAGPNHFDFELKAGEKSEPQGARAARKARRAQRLYDAE